MRQAAGAGYEELAGAVERAALLLSAGLSTGAALRRAGLARPTPGRIGESSGPGDREPGARLVRAALAVARGAGAPLAPVLLAQADELRRSAGAERELAVAAAGPLLTMRVLATLPGAGVVLALLLGLDIGAVLFGSPFGVCVLGLGIVLAAGGWWWSRRIVRSSVRAPTDRFEHLRLTAVALRAGLSPADAGRLAARALGDGPSEGEERIEQRAILLSRHTGAPLADLLENEALVLSRWSHAEALRRVEEVPTRLLLPLGLCCLPAFLLLAVVPAVMAILSSTVASV